MSDEIKTKSFSVYNGGLILHDKLTIEQFSEIIEKTKKDYPEYTWVEFYIDSSIFTGFSVIAVRELTDKEKDVDKRRAEYEVLKKEFEPKAKEEV